MNILQTSRAWLLWLLLTGPSQKGPTHEPQGASQFLFVHPRFLSLRPFLTSLRHPLRMRGKDVRKRREDGGIE